MQLAVCDLVNETRIYLVVRNPNRPVTPAVKCVGLPIQRDHIISYLGSNGSMDRNSITFERKAHIGIRLVCVAVQTSAAASIGTARH